ncbi:hypothetical protein D3C76_546020 [compost metagenome]
MLDESTGMKLGRRYRIESAQGYAIFEGGYFEDGVFFDSVEAPVAVGRLEGKKFVCNVVDGKGVRTFPGGIVGEIHNLILTMLDGTTLATRDLGNGKPATGDQERP